MTERSLFSGARGKTLASALGGIGLGGRHEILWSVAAGLVYGLAIALLTFRTELSVNSDGAYLLSGAVHLAAGHGLIGFDGEPLAYWPPVYPALMAVAVKLGFDVRWGAWAVNALAAFGTMSAIAYWLLTTCERRALALLGMVACAGLHPLLELLSDVHPDGLLLGLTLHSIAGAAVWLRGNPRGLVYGLVFAALAAVTKYQGLGILMGWGLLALMRARERGLTATVRTLAGVVIATSPLAAWLVRNVTMAGSPTGDRSTTNTMADYVSRYLPSVLDGVTSWYLPESLPTSLRVAIVVAGVVVLGVTLALLLRHERAHAAARAGGAALITMSGTYLVFTLVASIASMALGIQRYLALLAPMFVMMTMLALDRLAVRGNRKIVGVAAAVVAFVLLAVPMVRSAHMAARIQEGKAGYVYGDWYTEIRPALKQFPFDGVVLSNHAGFVWTSARVPERRVEQATWQEWLAAGPEAARGHIVALLTAPSPIIPAPARNLYFVEIYKSDHKALYAADLEKAFRLTPLVRVADGAIWKLECPEVCKFPGYAPAARP
ncbi:MAG: hypothetical protein K2Y35_18655 [Burkholderiales bacterium]|nr:hypothetical protein [Burkholderiales bacterium]